MAESVDRVLGDLEDAVLALKAAVQRHQWDVAVSATRAVLSAGSKLHQRMSSVRDLLAEGFAAAEVDRAMSRTAAEMPGQIKLEDAPSSKPKSRRIPRGGKEDK